MIIRSVGQPHEKQAVPGGPCEKRIVKPKKRGKEENLPEVEKKEDKKD